MSVDSVLDQAFTTLLGKVPRPTESQQAKLLRVVDVVLLTGALGTPLAGGEFVFLRLGLNGPAKIVTWSLAGARGGVPASSSCTVDVLAGPTLSSASSVCGGNRPALSSQIELNDQLPTNWTTSLPDPSSVALRVLAVDGLLEVIGLTLRVSVDTDALTGTVADSSGALVVDNNGNVVTWG